MKRLITTESVSYGHPDKIADQISDALLDAYLLDDPNSKAGIETLIKDNIVVIGGEVKSLAEIDTDKIIKKVIGSIVFTPEHHLNPENIKIINLLGKQSPEINLAVVKTDGEIGAGDQGLMFGYACSDTPNMMPMGMYLAKIIVDGVVDLNGLGPDAKSQVTMEVDENGNQLVHTILVSTMHRDYMPLREVQETIKHALLSNHFLIDELNFALITDKTKIYINPAGSWHIGGPVSDCGLTGRKIVVDQYGPYCPVGGGCLHGKDGSKTDRSAAYLARYIAKNIVGAKILKECQVELAYMIGSTMPVSIRIEGVSYGNKWVVLDEDFIEAVMKIFPMTPREIITAFNLTKPIFYDLARYGNFGISSINRRWEELDKVDELTNYHINQLPF